MLHFHEHLSSIIIIKTSDLLNHLYNSCSTSKKLKILNYRNFIKPKVGNITILPNPDKPGFYEFGLP